MFYREVGQYNDNYAAASRMVPVLQDRWIIIAVAAFMVFAVPFMVNDYWALAILNPVLILSLATLGLNILTGYTGQLSLGSAGFMMIGAFGTYNFLLRVDWMNIFPAMFLSGIIAGLVGVFFGLPSARIKGFYLLVSTLAAYYFIWWFFNTFEYFTNYTSSGVVTIPRSHYEIFGFNLASASGKYLITIITVIIMTLIAKNMVRSSIGRNWVAVRDQDIAANVIGIQVVRTKLIAFFVSSFMLAVSGALYSYTYLGNVGNEIYNLRRSFLVLFMVIIGGLGSIMGSFMGAAFVYLFPIVVSRLGDTFFGGGALDSAFIENNSKIVMGAIIIYLLIKEPAGFAAIWQSIKNKLRSWPFTT